MNNAKKIETHTLAILVDNEPGVLARVVGLFSGRGYNIESLTVSETEHKSHVSRITIVTNGTPDELVQIRAQLSRLVPVHKVTDHTADGNAIERELALVKVNIPAHDHAKVMEAVQSYNAKLIDTSGAASIFEISGTTAEVERFISAMASVGLAEVARTGIAAIARGAQAM